MSSLSKKERKRLALEKQRQRSREAQIEHQQRTDQFQERNVQVGSKKKMILLLVAAFFVMILAFAVYSMMTPGKYDTFAQCLTEKGVVMYGEDWCKYTNAQKAMFGKSFKHVNYQVKTNLNLRPTWVIDGETYETVQSFEKLSALTGCEY